MVTSGTVVAQVVIVATSPILSRVYTPEQFGAFSAFFALTSILLPLASLRYEVAIPLPKHERYGVAILFLCAILIPVVSLVATIIVWLQRECLANWMNCDLLLSSTWLLPIAVIVQAAFMALNYWGIRKRKFRLLAKAKILRACSLTLSQLSFASLGGIGLLIGHIVGGGVAACTIGTGAFRARHVRRKYALLLRKVAYRYRNFPYYSAVGGVVNSAGLGLPVILVSAEYGGYAAGQLGLLQRVLGLPMTLIGAAVADVYLAEAARRKEEGTLLSLFFRTSVGLTLMASVFGIAAFAAGPPLISIFLGDQWKEASEWARIIGMMLAVQLIATPVSQTLNIIDKQWLQLSWDVFRLAVVFGIFFYAARYECSVGEAIVGYGIVMIGAYALLWLIQTVALLWFSKCPKLQSGRY